MSEFDQVPFVDVGFAENPEPRCPCILLLDTSGSMTGTKIDELNKGLQTFAEELHSDTMAAKRVEVAIVTFGPVQLIQPFITADSFQPPNLFASGDTPMGQAILNAVNLISERKNIFRSNGIGYYRPWIFLITDGAPTDDISNAISVIREGETSKSFAFFAIGVKEADMNCLRQLSVREPLKLRELAFKELFVWLSNSLGSVARSQPGDAVPITTPSGWAVID
jgi:uncharacterized protein YegL